MVKFILMFSRKLWILQILFFIVFLFLGLYYNPFVEKLVKFFISFFKLSDDLVNIALRYKIFLVLCCYLLVKIIITVVAIIAYFFDKLWV